MATVLEVLARDHKFFVSLTNGSYTTISGINNFTWDESPGDADARHFDDGGHAANLVVSRDITVTLEGLKQVDIATGTRDAGQALVDASMSGSKFGRNRIRYYKIEMNNGDPDTLTPIGHVIFQGSAKPSSTGGGNDDLMPWGAEINVYGRPVSASGVYADLY